MNHWLMKSEPDVFSIDDLKRVRVEPWNGVRYIATGQVLMPVHFVETNSNRVTQSAYDPISREPNFKQCAVKVVKAESQHSGAKKWKV